MKAQAASHATGRSNEGSTAGKAGQASLPHAVAQAASPSSGLRPPSPTRGEGAGAAGPGAVAAVRQSRVRSQKKRSDDTPKVDVWGPSPLMGEGGRRPNECEATDTESAKRDGTAHGAMTESGALRPFDLAQAA